MEVVKFEIVDCKNNIVAIISEAELGCIDGYKIRATYEDESMLEGKNYNDFIEGEINEASK
jgi:hypothetical protein